MGEQAAPGKAFALRRVRLIGLLAEEGCMSVPIRDVLVVHPNAGRRAALASALPSCRVVAVESKTEAAYRMADGAPALIIAPPDDARLFLRQLASSAPDALRVFICSKSDPAGVQELMQSAAEGHVFSVLDDTLSGPELGRTISHLLQYRGSASISLSASYVVRFGLNGQGFVARCQDIGNFGATLLLPIDVPITTFPPGTALEALSIEREGHSVFKAAWAHVQRAQPVYDEQGPFLKVGVSWSTAMHQPPPAPCMTMEGASEVVATLRKAMRREAVLWLQLAEDSSMQLRLESPSIEVVNDIAVLRGQSSGLMQATLGDVVHLSFEMGGQSYSGVGSLLDNEPDGKLMVRVPRSLTVRNWRSLPRFKAGPEHRFLISFQAPVTGQHTTRSVLDLCVGGLSFPFDASCEILPAGSQLGASLLLPDGSSVDCEVEIRSIHALPSQGQVDGGLRPFRAGARFLTLPQKARDAILQAFVSSRCPAAVDGTEVAFRDIWRLMESARYRFHPDYPFEDHQQLQTLMETHHRVYASGELGRSIVYQNAQGLQGHISGLRIHSRTWLVQHLAVRPGFHRDEQISFDLTSLMVELGEVLEDVDFIRYSWRKDNRWPSRRMGWLARALETPGLSMLRQFNYLRLPLTSAPVVPPPGLPTVREARRGDLVWLEAYLHSRGEVVRMMCEDLRADDVELEALGRRYQAHGLHRRRRVFVVDGEHQPLALALCEESSPGLNLIEKTNAFWLVVPDREHPRMPDARRALVYRCIEQARGRDRPSALGFVDDEDMDALAQLGFENMGRFCEWAIHRSMFRRGCELWRSMFERLGRAQASDWTEEEES
jgi:hypothetical protein